jgi:heat shock transcription factor, other eukaryote
VQDYQPYQSPTIQELATPGHEGSPTLRHETPHQDAMQNFPSPIFSMPESPTITATSARATASPKNSLTPRLFSRTLGTPGAASKSLQEHNAQLAQKSREIEELERLQASQSEKVDGLMDMIQNFASHENHADLTDVGDVGNFGIDEYLNWGVPSGDPNGEAPLPGFDMGVDAQPIGEDVEDLFRFDKGIQDTNRLGPTSDPGVAQVLGTNPSTVAPSPAGSSTESRAREEIEEEIEEVTPKRRRMG